MTKSPRSSSIKAKAAKFNPANPEFRANPYPFYKRLRQEEPIHLSFMGAYVISRYEDVVACLHDRRFSSTPVAISPYSPHKSKDSQIADISSNIMFFRDPPDHTRLRSLTGKAFNPRVVESLRPRIQTIVDSLIKLLLERQKADLIVDFAAPLPVTVISEMLGVPESDRPLLHEWSYYLAQILNPIASPQVRQQIENTLIAARDYFATLIVQKRKQPQPDVLTALIEARDVKDRLSEDELLATCMMLFATGEETTVNLIGNGMYALLSHPEQLQKLRQQPHLIDSAIEELLRYDCPVQMAGRTALTDIELHGYRIRKGQPIFALLGSANRDPAQFSDPDRLDITRQPNPHLAFGTGIHACIGAGLARVQGQIAIDTLLQTFSRIELATDKVEWDRGKTYLRGLNALRVEVSP